MLLTFAYLGDKRELEREERGGLLHSGVYFQ